MSDAERKYLESRGWQAQRREWWSHANYDGNSWIDDIDALVSQRYADAAVREAVGKAKRECETCGCEGIIHLTDATGELSGEIAQCPECQGTGIGGWGQAIDAAVRKALKGAAKVADKEGSICHYGVDSDGKTVPDMVGVHCGNANKVAARIRAMIPTGGEEVSDA